MPAKHELSFNVFIDNHRRAIKYHVLIAVGIFMLGIVMVTVALLLPKLGDEQLQLPKSMIGIGGTLIFSLSTLQLKEIQSRKEKIAVLRMAQIRVSGFDKEKNSDPEEHKLMWTLIEKAAMG